MPLETLEGSVERITYYNPENGYSVIRLLPTSQQSFWGGRDDEGLVTVIGNLPDLVPGESVKLEGTWQTHSSYGKQFRAENVERTVPATIEGMRRYLGSGLVKGIGPRTASRIVDHFGAATIDVLEKDIERLYEVEGVGRHRVNLISKAWLDQREIKQVMLFLQSHGVTTSLAVKIFKTYGNDAIKQVQSNPYQLARDIHGVGFKTADKIARDLGLTMDHPERLAAGLVYALTQSVDDGHVYLPEEELIKIAAELLEVDPVPVADAITRAAEADMVKLDLVHNDAGESIRAVYLPPLYFSEIGITRVLRRMVTTPGSRVKGIQSVPTAVLVEQVARESKIELSHKQHSAVAAALEHKMSILTGGPGTGKTTTLRAVIGALMSVGATFALASPTGRAAKRLSEATGQPARTIHRMLGFSPVEGFSHNEDNPLPVDMVIVDEASMLDEVLAYGLFRAIDPTSHLLLVGDVDQLPSVGAGDVLRDLIASGQFAVTRLDVIFRQAEDSGIISNAHRINRGDMPIFPQNSADFFLFNVGDDPDKAAEMVIDIVKNRAPTRFGVSAMDDIQVIAPMYRGAAGVAKLNFALQEALNPPGKMMDRLMTGRWFRVGDKVMQTRNNYDKEVFNGDVGRIRSFDLADQTMEVVFDGRSVHYDFSEIPDDLLHAYAISVHRSQGSEYPVVVIPLLAQHYMLLQRNLLYTAITRAKRIVIIVGSQKAIAMAVRNDAVSQRYTALAERLRTL